MRITQIILPGASEYERKSQRVDHAALSAAHEVSLVHSPIDIKADVAHVYGPSELPRSLFRKFRIPYIANGTMKRRRFTLGSVPEPDYVTSPIGDGEHELLPEAVEEKYFDSVTPTAEEKKKIGTFGPSRPYVKQMVEQTMHRLQRFRDDVEWLLFDRVPEPADLAAVDVWVDPATSESDYDGFVAEGLAAGKLVIATRTALNSQRLEKGRTGWLVPAGDPNELTHAILAALFKPEAGEAKAAAARQTISKFRSRQRMRVLAHMYETLTS